MGRRTIDFGIDLGTTNSEIAVLKGTKPDVIPNSEGSEITPSAVFLDKRGQVFVGREAKDKYEEESENCELEFKLRMGQGAAGAKIFKAAKRTMLPEEMSAEVLKSLKADVRQQSGEEITAAVITVPADFDRPQTDATVRAGQLAGFKTVQLLQEPVAAALAYGFQEEGDKLLWLVYDFGGGTFDAAVMQVRDGFITVINHEGDNNLGGKLIDWDIVNKKLIPALTAKYKLSDFHRGSKKWAGAIAKLKIAAEKAKIQISRTGAPAGIYEENLCDDESGTPVELEYELTPSQLEEITTPYVVRSINLCRKALSEKGLLPTNIQKILMVGGTSCLPSLRDRLTKELGIALDFKVNPMTVVAQGAAIYAAGIKVQDDSETVVPVGTYKIELPFDPVGCDTEPPIAGKVIHPKGASLDGFTIEFVESQIPWKSGKIPLNANGAFMADLHAVKGRRCEYAIGVFDTQGTQIKVEPDRCFYTVGGKFSRMPLPHSIGIVMANNEMDEFFKKGTPMPVSGKSDHITVREVRKGQSDLLRITVCEGENVNKANRNRPIGQLIIPSDRVKRDVPMGSDVEIRLYVDVNKITVKAFVPILDEEFEATLKLEEELPTAAELKKTFQELKKRLEDAKTKASQIQDAKAKEALSRIEAERMIEQIQSHIDAVEAGDRDALMPCRNRMLNLAAAIDDVDDALEWPVLVKDAQQLRTDAQNTVSAWGNSEEKSRLPHYEAELQKAIDSHDSDMLKRKKQDLLNFASVVWDRRPEVWVIRLEHLEKPEVRSTLRDQAQAEQLFRQGRRAISSGDVVALEAAVRQLWKLLPGPPPSDGVGDTIKTRGVGI